MTTSPNKTKAEFYKMGKIRQKKCTLFALWKCNTSFLDVDQHAISLFQGVELMMPPLLCSPKIDKELLIDWHINVAR